MASGTVVASALRALSRPEVTTPAWTGVESPDRDARSDDSQDHDAALLTAIVAGDARALDELYQRYRPAAFAAAFFLLRDPHAAEDTVHDAFLSIWRGAASFQPSRGSLRAWLLTIVRNAAIDQLRARRRAPRPQPTLEIERRHEPVEEDVATNAIAAADARRLYAALRVLPPAQQHAVELAFFAGLTHGEIAARTGLPLGTVKGRVRLGLQRLRHELRDLAPTAPPRAAPALALAGGD